MSKIRQARKILLSFLVVAFAAAVALTPAAFAAEAPILEGLSPAEKARVQKLIEGAKKEGKVVMLTNTMGPDIALPLFEDFKKQYGLPNVRLAHTMKRSGGVISTIKKDISAKRDTFDIVQVGSPAFFWQLDKRNALMEYKSPYYENFISEVTGNKLGAVAKPGYFISSHSNIAGIIWNTKFVKKDIKTWEDVLDPKFKGKIIVADILKSATIVNVYGGLRKVLPRSYFEKLAKLDPVFILSHRSHVRKVVAGEKWISVMTMTGLAYKEAAKGAPVKGVVPPGGAVALGYPFGILAKAPNPNAAKLWVDYLHTRHGHLKYLNMKGFGSGIKNATLNPLLATFVPALEKLEIIPMDWSKVGPKQIKAWRAEYREIFYGK